MKQRIKYKILTDKNCLEYKTLILDLMDKDRKRPKEITRSIKNSKFIIIALSWEKVVWINQIISDLYYWAFYINLFVSEEFRNLWIWGKLIDISNKLVIKKNIKWVELITNPDKSWLPKFYSKHWFKNDTRNWTYMSLNKSKI